MNVLGILCGVGSLLREAQDAGFEVLANMETRTPYITGRHLSWDLNFPNVVLRRDPFVEGEFEGVDLVIGHPPCGSHSQLGMSGQPAHLTKEQREALTAKRQSRIGLLPLFVGQVNVIKPKMFILDNLPKIMKTITPEAWWKSMLPDYRLEFVIMKNWDYGTPQPRQRLWVIGTRRGIKRFRFTPPRGGRLPGPKTAMEAFFGLPVFPYEDVPRIGHVHVQPHLMLTGDYRTTIPDLNVRQATELALGFLSIPPDKAWPYTTRFGRLASKIGRQRLNIHRHSRTITGLPSVHHPITGWPLTGRERARLMDWPDDFHLGNEDTVYDRRALMRLTLLTGKAVPSGFPRYLLPQIRRHLRRHG